MTSHSQKHRRRRSRNPTRKELRDADRLATLHPEQQRNHPCAVAADPAKLTHINTYGDIPEFYIDRPFTCRVCGKTEIWLADDQKWYYEEAKGHVDAIAVECHDCRRNKKDSR